MKLNELRRKYKGNEKRQKKAKKNIVRNKLFIRSRKKKRAEEKANKRWEESK